MRCEVCGHKIHTEPLYAIIEGAKLTVCLECSKHGKVIAREEADIARKIARKTEAPITLVQKKTITPKVQLTQELAEDYTLKIKGAREKMGLTHEELGKKINEKASVLRNLEAGKMAPNNQLAQKLEHMLKIKLLVPISEEKATKEIPKKANQELTLGDLIQIDSMDKEAPKERKPS